MEKLKYSAVIKFVNLKGKKSREIKDELDCVYVDAYPWFTMTKRCVAYYKRSRTSILNEKLSGRPKTATTEEMIDLVHQIVREDHWLTVMDIGKTRGIPSEQMHKIYI